ncbi:hypothetical protein [Xylophilus sp.]|uniref:hypothetical protein n=1 Tax=Xylophilus sp. TaxID=2653893 RepID=UPI002D7E9780|nr:hypothetical protein [Xylophilus sp.]
MVYTPQPSAQARRRQLLGEALLHNELVAYIPLYNQIVPWAMRRSVELPHRAYDRTDWRNIRLH